MNLLGFKIILHLVIVLQVLSSPRIVDMLTSFLLGILYKYLVCTSIRLLYACITA